MSPVVIIPNCDGSPPTEAVVHDTRQIFGQVITIQEQGGKGLALKQGLTRAAEMSFTHAITMDADGRHSPNDLKKFLEAIDQNPNAIIIGVRQDLPRSIRIARAHCDFWVWTATGRWIHDTPNGYRAFPLSLLSDLSLRCDQFDFEIEILVKAIWAGGEIIEVPVSAAGGSELIPFSDAARLGWLMTALISQRLLLPSPLLGQIHKKEFADLPLSQRVRRIFRDAILLNSDQPRSFAACIALGVFFGILPIWGFQMLAAAATAHALRLSKPLVLAASNISTPITIPFILYLSLIIGHLLHRGHFEGLPSLHDLHQPMILGEYIAGSVALAIAAGIIAGLLAYAAASALKAARGKRAC
jgi:uncharacterized protein (DUF2062 family)